MFTADEFRPLIDWAIRYQSDPDEIDHDEARVECVSFEGSLAEYLATTGG